MTIIMGSLQPPPSSMLPLPQPSWTNTCLLLSTSCVPPNPNSNHVLRGKCNGIDSPSGFSFARTRMDTICRSISGQDTGTALRPFYFVVHPDLFGKFPEQRVSDRVFYIKRYLLLIGINLCARSRSFYSVRSVGHDWRCVAIYTDRERKSRCSVAGCCVVASWVGHLVRSKDAMMMIIIIIVSYHNIAV